LADLKYRGLAEALCRSARKTGAEQTAGQIVQAQAEILSRLHRLASTQDSQGEWQAIQRALV
jgi:hypothetical protein